MAKEFKLPDLGEGIHEGEVLAVRVGVGQAVREGDIILEVETDKAAVELPSPYTGTVLEIRVKPGETVRVGQVLMVFAESGDKAAAAPEPEAAAPARAVAPAAAALPAQTSGPRQGPIPASPATRRLARELGVDLAR
ncbi:MAG TPA: biotin/lipoyl-containing protein, partial [Desulfobacterales bacterium]|nr:biotin/lipoyl-containing protein [Desulfobacterales bacterium]